MADQDAGWVDEDGLCWCAWGGAAAIRPAWFHTLVSVMSPSSPADRLLALRREGFTLQVDGIDAAEWIHAEHPSGLTVFGRRSRCTRRCATGRTTEDYDLEFASSPAEHAHQKAAFDHAYHAVQAVAGRCLASRACRVVTETRTPISGAPGGSGRR